MQDIEILNDPETGTPQVTLYGDARTKAHEKGIVKVLVSLSHSEVSLSWTFGLAALTNLIQTVAIAFAQASRST